MKSSALHSRLTAFVAVLNLAWFAGVESSHAGGSEPEWPQFHGPRGEGRAHVDNPGPVEFGLERNVEWSVELPSGHSSPCVSGDRIFLTAFDKAARKLSALCVDRSNGRLLWKRERSVEKFEDTHDISNPATATPATDGKAVFIYWFLDDSSGCCG